MFSNVRSHLILRSGGGLISFNNNNPDNFSYDQKCMQQQKWQIWRKFVKGLAKIQGCPKGPLKK